MAHKSYLPNALQDYVLATWLREPDVLRRLREETAALPSAGFQIPPDQGQLMALLVKILGAKDCLEVGVYTGYSALSVALALPEGGRIVACDVSEEYTSIAKRYWEEANVNDRIELHLRPAVETLDWLIADGQVECFDFAFIDADKANYVRYYERVLQLLKPGGVVLIDNVLWHGDIIEPTKQDPDTTALRELNKTVGRDKRVEVALIPIGDGVTIARKN